MGVSAVREVAGRTAPVVLVAVLALLVATLGQLSASAALSLAAGPLVLTLLVRPHILGAAGIALLPLSIDLANVGPFIVGLADLLLTLAVVGLALDLRRTPFRELAAVKRAVVLYAGVLAVAVAGEFGLEAVANAGQRLQLVIVGIAVGVAVARAGLLTGALYGYVATAGVMSTLTLLDVVPAALAQQKNPLGQFIAGALLVAVARPGQRLHLIAIPVLAGGLLRTESRGALLGLLVGLGVLIVAQPGLTRLKATIALVPLAVVLGVAFTSLPDDVQRRTTTLRAAESGVGTSGEFTIKVRAEYREDALAIISANPLLGVGIDNYQAGNDFDGTLTNDPHNVLLLEAAEGGMPLLVALLGLLSVAVSSLWRIRHISPMAATALAVTVATLAHALVDVYWVRGTPVLGWFLVGAALADARWRCSKK